MQHPFLNLFLFFSGSVIREKQDFQIKMNCCTIIPLQKWHGGHFCLVWYSSTETSCSCTKYFPWTSHLPLLSMHHNNSGAAMSWKEPVDINLRQSNNRRGGFFRTLRHEWSGGEDKFNQDALFSMCCSLGEDSLCNVWPASLSDIKFVLMTTAGKI